MVGLGDIKIKRKADGGYYVQPYMGVDKATGRVLRPYKSFPSTLTEEELRERVEEWYRGILPYVDRHIGYRLSDVLESYISSIKIRGASANTVKTYRSLKGYTVKLAGRDVRGISTGDVEKLYEELLEDRGLSAATVRMLDAFLSGAFKWMARNKLIPTSPMHEVDRPRRRSKEAGSLTRGQISRLEDLIGPNLSAAGIDGAASFAAWLGLNMGLRVGEACAVRVDDCRLLIPDMMIRGTITEAGGPPAFQPWTKGKRPRTIAIPSEGVGVVAARIGAVEAIARRNPSGAPLVTLDGSIMRPRDISHAVAAYMRDSGVRDDLAHFHTLRHTHATGLLAAGVDIETVSIRLGHANASTTLRIYAHAIPDKNQQAADNFSAFKRGER